jgi:hypothetical protein
MIFVLVPLPFRCSFMMSLLAAAYEATAVPARASVAGRHRPRKNADASAGVRDV